MSNVTPMKPRRGEKLPEHVARAILRLQTRAVQLEGILECIGAAVDNSDVRNLDAAIEGAKNLAGALWSDLDPQAIVEAAAKLESEQP